jgi:hypothetical protein
LVRARAGWLCALLGSSLSCGLDSCCVGRWNGGNHSGCNRGSGLRCGGGYALSNLRGYGWDNRRDCGGDLRSCCRGRLGHICSDLGCCGWCCGRGGCGDACSGHWQGIGGCGGDGCRCLGRICSELLHSGSKCVRSLFRCRLNSLLLGIRESASRRCSGWHLGRHRCGLWRYICQ